MQVKLKVRDIAPERLEASVSDILARVDRGEFDAQLSQAGVTRKADAPLQPGVTFKVGQGLSPDQWADIAVAFAPVVGEIAADIWRLVVVPQLKRIFREDQIKSD